MAYKIEVPEVNTVYEFPDGTSQDVMNEYIKSKHPDIQVNPIIPTQEAWYNPIRSAKAMGSRIASTFNGGVSNIINGVAKMNKMLDDIGSRRMADLMQQGYKPDADMLAAIDHHKASRDVFQPKLEASVNYFKENEVALRRTANKHGLNFIEETIADTVGGFLPFSLEFMLGVPWAVGVGMADAHEQGRDNLLWDGLKAGAHRYAMGKIFHGIQKLPTWAAVPSTGTVFAADTYWQSDGDWREVTKAFGSGLFLSGGFAAGKKLLGTGKDSNEKPFYDMNVTEFSKKVTVDAEGRMFIRATGEEIPFTQHQRKLRSQLTPEEWVAEGHENVLRIAYDRGLSISEQALDGHGILKHFIDVESDSKSSLAAKAETESMSTSTKVESGQTKGEAVKGEPEPSMRVQMSDADVLRISESITKKIEKGKVEEAATGKQYEVHEFSNINTYGDVARIIDTIAADKISKEVVGGVRTLEAVREAANARAQELGFNLTELKTLSNMLKETPEKVTAWMDFLVKDSEVLCKLRDKAKSNTPEDLAAFQEHLMFTSEITALLKGISADSSRILGSRRIRIDGNSIDIDAVKRGLEKFDGLKAGDAAGMVDGIKKMKGSPLGNILLEYSNINILASPTVHAFNFLGNTIKPFIEVGQTYSEAAFSRLFKNSKDYNNRVTMGEANAYSAAMLHTAAEVFIKRPIAGVKSVVKGTPEYLKGKKFTDILKDIIDAPEKLEQHLTTSGIDPMSGKAIEASGGGGALSSMYLKETKAGKLFDGIVGESTFGNVMWKSLDVFGALGRDASYGLLTVFDKPFKELHYNGMLAREVYRASLQKEFTSVAERQAFTEKLSDSVMKYRMKEDFIPTDAAELRLIQAIDKKALTSARDGTWQSELGETGKAIEKVLATHPAWKILGVRFFKTPVNLLKEIGRNSPLALLQEQTRANLAGVNGIRAQTKAFAQQLTGGLIMFGAWSLVNSDIITGSHPPDQREALLAAGIPEYAIKIGDRYYQYNRTDPYTIPLAVIADTVNAMRYMDADRGGDVFSILMMSLGNSLFNKTWATQLGDVFAAIRDPKREGFRYFKNLTTSMLPASGMARFINAQTDPLMRECESILDTVRNVYMPKDSRASLDWLGMEREHHRRIGMRIDTPSDKDPIYLEAARLGMNVNNLSDRVSLGKGEVKLTSEEHWQLQKSLDEKLKMKDFLNEFIQRDSYRSMSDAAKEETLKKIVSIFHRRAKGVFMSEHDDIREALIGDTQYRVNMLTGGSPSQRTDSREEVNEFIKPHQAKHLTR